MTGEYRKQKGRAIGNMILSIRKNLIMRDGKEVQRMEEIMVGKVKSKKGILRVMGVYINGEKVRRDKGMIREKRGGNENNDRKGFQRQNKD